MKVLTAPLLLAFVGLAVAPSSGLAQGRPHDLGQLSIEDLMNVEITSASRKEQRTGDVAAAVFVISQDDIRRSGMTSIPDVLRMAPGVDVAQINANKWAVSIRGFNGLYADKLLVLIDGRSVYNRIFSGVFWDAEDLMLDDVDHIEVIRGPGAAIWGANAMNGVINIVTKATADTKGGLVRADVGRAGDQGAVRYGGALGSATYRVYSQWTRRNDSLLAPNMSADDGSQNVSAGFRADWTTRPDAFTLEGDLTAGRSRALWTNLDPQTFGSAPVVDDPSDSRGGHLLGRWTRTRPGGAVLQIQSFVEFANRHEPVGDYDHQVVDIDAQYHTTLGARQDLVFGAGYRFTDEGFDGQMGFALTPDEDRSSLVTAFLQDEIALLGNRLAITLGSQVQHDPNVGMGVQPTARAMWKALPHQRLWAAVSRALRLPSLYERGLRLDYPPVPSASGLPVFASVLGNPAEQAEKLVDAEAGYRLEFGAAASIDVTGFVGRYDQLQTQEQSAPVVQFVPTSRILVTTQFGNQLAGSTRGLEIAGHWAPLPAWRFDGSYSAFHIAPDLAATSLDTNGAQEDGSAPGTQWQLRTALSPSPRTTVNVAIFHAGPIVQLQVPAYTRADINAEWRCTSHLSATVVGQNIFDPAHLEFTGAGSLLQATEVARSGSLRLRWTF